MDNALILRMMKEGRGKKPMPPEAPESVEQHEEEGGEMPMLASTKGRRPMDNMAEEIMSMKGEGAPMEGGDSEMSLTFGGQVFETPEEIYDFVTSNPDLFGKSKEV